MTGRELPPVCIGTYTLASVWAGDPEQSKAALAHAVDQGLALFDTAHAYGRAERILGTLFADRLRRDRDSLVLCSKGGLELRDRPGAATPFVPNSRPEFLRSSLLTSLSRLGVEQLDMYLVHWFDPEVPVDEVAAAMRDFVDEGLTRAVGVSNFTVEQLTRFTATAPLDVVQVPYSLFSRDVEREILPFAQRHDVTVLGYAALAQGYLSGTFGPAPAFPSSDFRSQSPDFGGDRYAARVAATARLSDIAARHGVRLPELAVAWARSHPVTAIPIVGVQAPEHVDALRRALTIELTGADLDAIRRIVEPVPEMDFAGLVS
ncbi:aldo/keto reductase [Jiangella endophytica]|uniref:aldo/keto reductase n=1 Tax=Jiangella endophytica TaxID=1623398 RepID=UPI0013008FDE|nr:aldo/keto reductase [Jiangella endophytica]